MLMITSQVRFATLRVVEAIAQKLGDEYATLLAETVPFLAELMEGKTQGLRVCKETLSLIWSWRQNWSLRTLGTQLGKEIGTIIIYVKPSLIVLMVATAACSASFFPVAPVNQLLPLHRMYTVGHFDRFGVAPTF